MATRSQVQAAVDRLGESLDRPVLVEDPRHLPLWWSVQGQVDGVRTRSILQRTADPAATAVVTRLGLARTTEPVRVPAAPEADMLARWCVPLRSGRDLLGYLWVLDPDGRVTDAQLKRSPAVTWRSKLLSRSGFPVRDANAAGRFCSGNSRPVKTRSRPGN
jgi:GAF domain-containing protein